MGGRHLRAVAATMVIAATWALAGCAGPIDAPPGDSAEAGAPAVTPDAPEAAGIARVTVPALSQDGIRRRAARFTLRVRNLTCDGLGTGSGFALDAHTLVTNRHVVAGAELLEVDTTDGRSLTVNTAQVGVLGDVAFITIDETLPVTAEIVRSLRQGTDVSAVGFPEGGPFTITNGVVVDRIDGTDFDVPGDIVRITAKVRPGNSGGPLIDARGRVVGVVYAIEIATGLGLAIPIDTFQRLLDEAGTEGVPACGSE